jgi:hypothetical protein
VLRVMISALLLSIVPAGWCMGQSSVSSVTGIANTLDEFAQAQENQREAVPINETFIFAYCVCAADRNKVAFAHSRVRGNADDVIADCILTAGPCGGCFKPPVYKRLGASERRVELERQRQLLEAGRFWDDERRQLDDDFSKVRGEELKGRSMHRRQEGN